MEMVLIPADQLRTMMIESASIALKHNLPQVSCQSAESDRPLTREQTAEFFGVSLVTIHSWERKGLICGYHLGNKKFYLRSELMASLVGRKGKAV